MQPNGFTKIVMMLRAAAADQHKAQRPPHIHEKELIHHHEEGTAIDRFTHALRNISTTTR
jgi:hypothetical protein